MRLLNFAVELEREFTGVDLLGSDLAIVAAGNGDEGGTSGVNRRLIELRAMAKLCLQPSGRPKYRFIGLFDNDQAGRQAIQALGYLDRSIIEYKEVFRLHPVMPKDGNLDPMGLQLCFERANAAHKGIDWEIEDLIPESLFNQYVSEFPNCLRKTKSVGGRTHRELTQDGKARLHRFVSENAIRADLEDVISVIKAIRFYLGLPPSGA